MPKNEIVKHHIVEVNKMIEKTEMPIFPASKCKQNIKFYNGVFGLSLNCHLKQTAVMPSVLFITIFGYASAPFLSLK